MSRALLALVILLWSGQAWCEKFDLNVFQQPSGAITVLYGGDVVDPYFANKALLVAGDSGLDISDSGKKWIEWAILHQNPDGLFSRYCAEPGENWVPCAESDADDAALALWLELLYKMSPPEGIPEKWEASMDMAKEKLDSLYDRRLGVYQISASKKVGLFMDNVEIYAAYKSIAQEQKRLGMNFSAWFTGMKAANILHGITRVFGNGDDKPFSISTQERTQNLFYPDRVAEIFPYLYKLPEAVPQKLKSNFQDWMAENGSTWLNMSEDNYPWGLIAVTALNLGETDIAYCWLHKAEPYRYGKRWNVLEEAAYWNVKTRLSRNPPLHPVACSELQ